MTQPKRRKPGKHKPKQSEPQPLPELTEKQKRQLFDLAQTVRKIVRQKAGKANT